MMFQSVYQLRSMDHPDRHYTGLTCNLDRRLIQHNQGEVPCTAPDRPWRIEIAVAFRDHSKAAAFEQYLKSHSARAFSKRHF
jgi:predicted GIY-YIG superfamily endonuclease